ncbi:hypothetical protein [Parabacteroides sp. FAFU027]|uniref:hypothetical protein n=1 Tax=Parabacteroides sp. FAFU027 TaxID=2922715 RepID=UPI001FB03F30|nr:hypothetical protein [Parabacteroides sp. FAFU027]
MNIDNTKAFKAFTKSSGLIVLISLFTACNNPTCKDYVENDFRKQSYNIVILEKYQDTRYYRIIGVDKLGNLDTTEECAIQKDLYEKAMLGDTLKKERCKLEMTPSHRI